jgi:hypothetical protein
VRLAVLVALAFLLAPAATPGQGLGDAAAREQKKRAQTGAPAAKKVFTDEDLPPSTAPPPARAADRAKAEPSEKAKDTGTAAAKGEGNADPLEVDRRERQRLEADWRVRFARARERLALAEAGAWREVVRTEFYQGIPVQMKVREKVETAELVAARQALADLEEEFRRTGLPPGWARER